MKVIIICTLFISLINTPLLPLLRISAAEERGLSQMKSAQKEVYDAHRSYTRFHFTDNEMDFAFQWLLGSIVNGGAEIGEAFYVAAHIEDGNPKSWQDEWERMALRKELRARRALDAGHLITARQCLLKASNYYRTALVSRSVSDGKFNTISKKVRSCMQAAAPLFSPAMIYFEVPFAGTVLPGYYRPVQQNGTARKTLLMIGGGETFVEDNIFYIEPQAILRGYNFVTVDIPGQGMLPSEGLFFKKDTEIEMKAILDVILDFAEIDPERLAVYGISNGGYFVPRAATLEKRIKAIVVSSAVVDNYLMFKEMPFSKESQEQIDSWPAFKKAVTSGVTWRWGLEPENIKGQTEQTRGFQFNPALITCPVLDLVGAGEYVNRETERQQQEFMAKLGSKNKTLIVTPEDEGASSHCIGENRSLMAELVFDWLDELWPE
ncbi:alpha/beta hydrolase family protein [Desulfotalea psychrophila]|uniref:Alpha/beta hydrolase n=1 Tax=Desulfotalea psychrophila (strain LSv54 / DSM 12343) TaxID=177439 RepID=Q6AKV7_DESPS|nr:alpha/beta hydrolase [Desulfotalea psychrophila]CAG37018.1 hypothetical protein DP2289 [Desulfotalea psychrophila LSv54]